MWRAGRQGLSILSRTFFRDSSGPLGDATPGVAVPFPVSKTAQKPLRALSVAS